MSAISKIEWTDHTFNPWIGCTKVSPGCAHCYAEARDKRHLIEKVDHWGKSAPRLRTSAANWRQPLIWNRKAGQDLQNSHPPRVFCASLADVFDDEVPIEWLADLLELIHATPNLDWQLLTKRPENWSPRVRGVLYHLSNNGAPDRHDAFWNWLVKWSDREAPANVWVGTSVENQDAADKRIPELLKIPARVRFLSCEPLLGPFQLHPSSFIPHPFIDWVIVGGESGPSARPCNIDWIRSLIGQCKSADVRVFVKQLGARVITKLNATGFSLCDRKGGDWNEWPEDLRVREFPSEKSRFLPVGLPGQRAQSAVQS